MKECPITANGLCDSHGFCGFDSKKQKSYCYWYYAFTVDILLCKYFPVCMYVWILKFDFFPTPPCGWIIPNVCAFRTRTLLIRYITLVYFCFDSCSNSGYYGSACDSTSAVSASATAAYDGFSVQIGLLSALLVIALLLTGRVRPPYIHYPLLAHHKRVIRRPNSQQQRKNNQLLPYIISVEYTHSIYYTLTLCMLRECFMY